MAATSAPNDLSSEMELDAYRRLFPLRFHERHLRESIRPDGRSLVKARETTIMFGAVASANGSALVKIGCTTMLAAIKMEVMTPTAEAPDEGCIAIEFHMPPICSPLVRPGRPAEIAPVISKQLSDTISSSGMIDLKELCLVSGKAAWMAYLDIYCLDADGALFDAALLSSVAAFSHLQIPVVSLNDDGRVVLVPEGNAGSRKKEKEPVNKDKIKLTLNNLPFALTFILHKNYILADPTSEEESVMETFLTVVLDSSSRLVSLNKPGGPGLTQRSAIQECIALTEQRAKELQGILNEKSRGGTSSSQSVRSNSPMPKSPNAISSYLIPLSDERGSVSASNRSLPKKRKGEDFSILVNSLLESNKKMQALFEESTTKYLELQRKRIIEYQRANDLAQRANDLAQLEAEDKILLMDTRLISNIASRLYFEQEQASIIQKRSRGAGFGYGL